MHRGLSLSCTYPSPHHRGHRAIGRDQKTHSSPALSDRIAQLEQLVSSLMKNNANNLPNSGHGGVNQDVGIAGQLIPTPTSTPQIKPHSHVQPPESNRPSDSFGHISLQDSKTTYVDDTHWTAILDGVSFVFGTLLNYFVFDRELTLISSRFQSLKTP